MVNENPIVGEMSEPGGVIQGAELDKGGRAWNVF